MGNQQLEALEKAHAHLGVLFSTITCSDTEQISSNTTMERLYKTKKTSFEKNCFSAWASALNMGLINKVDMVCLSPVGYGV